MTYIEIIILALALSIDACVVSFSYGLAFKENRMKNAMLLAWFTGVFQGLMPWFAYYLTGFVKSFIAPYASWIVFIIFMVLGIKFICEAWNEEETKPLCIGLSCLLMLGIATSIDAFSAGISLSLYGNKIFKPVVLIFLVTFINSLLGFWLGGKLQKIPCKFLEILGGLLLIGLGIKAII